MGRGRPKQVFKCIKCSRDTFRDKFNLDTHMKVCNGILGQAEKLAAQSIVSSEDLNINFEPMQRSSLQTQSISAKCDELIAKGSSTVQSVLNINVVDFSEIFVAMFRFSWLSNDNPEHHHVLGCHEGLHPSECLVYKRKAWHITEFITEIRECLNEVSTRVYNVEDEIRAAMSNPYYVKFDQYRTTIENITANKTEYEIKLAEGDLISEDNLDARLFELVKKIRVELANFTAMRPELFEKAKSEAEASRVCECNLQDGVSRMKLVIKAHEGAVEKTIHLDVAKSDTIDSVKRRIQEQEGYPSDQQFLVLGIRLEDGRTLADYDIFNNTVLHMRLKPAQTPQSST